MSDWKKALLQQGMKWIGDPRIARVLQDERVMKAVMTAMSVPTKAQEFAREHVETIAKTMALATEGELKDLRRTVRRLEDEISQMKAEQSDPRATKKNPRDAA